jgi:hypothetical protein
MHSGVAEQVHVSQVSLQLGLWMGLRFWDGVAGASCSLCGAFALGIGSRE